MSDSYEISKIDDNSSLYEILKVCASFQSTDSLPLEDFNDVHITPINANDFIYIKNCGKMISTNQYSVSGNISNCSYTTEDSLGDNILEENGRISLAYENLKTIPRGIAEKFAMQTKFLDLSYNHFQNLSFLSFFDDLHTLILDRNTKLDANTLPSLQNLKILWINNCDIKNIIEWIQRIRIQCPKLEHLSIMGNPGIKETLNVYSLDMFNDTSNIESILVNISIATDYKKYILQMLPHLQYLDGVHRDNLSKLFQFPTNGALTSSSSTSLSQNYSARNGTSQCQQSNAPANKKISPTISFKDLFQLKRCKKSDPSSSTN